MKFPNFCCVCFFWCLYINSLFGFYVDSFNFPSEASNSNIDLLPIWEQHGESIRKSFGSSNPHALSLGFVMLCLAFTILLNTWQRYNIDLNHLQHKPLVFFSFSSGADLAVAWFSILVIYTADRVSCSCCWILVFMEGEI